MSDPLTTPDEALQENRAIARQLREAASLIEDQGGNVYRAAAYRRAARTVEDASQPLRRLFDAGGIDALDALPGIGKGIAASIAEMLITGQWNQLRRLLGEAPPVRPWTPPRRGGAEARDEPSVALILDVDREYRERARAGALVRIAPKRLNPTGDAWLPVLHTARDRWHFTALYSNTARAHELGRTHDWVCVYFYDGDHTEHERTVVTETRGPLAGERVVRGRERECRQHYASLDRTQ